MRFLTKCGHMTHHSKAENVGITHLCITMESSGYFGNSLFQRLCRWSCDLFETKIESAAFWLYHRRWLGHSIPVSLVASRCVWDERQHETWSWKKLSNHPCVRTSRSKFPNDPMNFSVFLMHVPHSENKLAVPNRKVAVIGNKTRNKNNVSRECCFQYGPISHGIPTMTATKLQIKVEFAAIHYEAIHRKSYRVSLW